MSDDRNKPRATFYFLAMVIVLPIMYFLSIGPVTSLVISTGEPKWSMSVSSGGSQTARRTLGAKNA